MRLIDADALIERMKKDPLYPLVERYGVTGVIEAAPTVDAVPVVRCKDCKHRRVHKSWVECELDSADPYDQGRTSWDDDWFCADGERRDDG